MHLLLIISARWQACYARPCMHIIIYHYGCSQDYFTIQAAGLNSAATAAHFCLSVPAISTLSSPFSSCLSASSAFSVHHHSTSQFHQFQLPVPVSLPFHSLLTGIPFRRARPAPFFPAAWLFIHNPFQLLLLPLFQSRQHAAIIIQYAIGCSALGLRHSIFLPAPGRCADNLQARAFTA